MLQFAEESGLTNPGKSPKRYLWTDAFAVCNFLGLYLETEEARYKELALALVAQVHRVLGCYAENDPREGRISGLSEEEGRKHPTAGGLRIGKPLPERGKEMPYDAQTEWDRDGQYFHYLTKWMHALSRVTQVTGDPVYNRWAIELAQSVHAKFTYFDESIHRKRLVWKMSVDLSRTLVPSMGQHDALDAWIVYSELQAVARTAASDGPWPDLHTQIEEAGKISELNSMLTDDPLGLGGLLSDVCLCLQVRPEAKELVHRILQSATEGMRLYGEGENRLDYPAEYRLAFRELGLAIGLKALESAAPLVAEEPLFRSVRRYDVLAGEIIRFWTEKAHQQNSVWLEHKEINSVMLATALSPEGYHALKTGE